LDPFITVIATNTTVMARLDRATRSGAVPS
jgi:hypothetical protein